MFAFGIFTKIPIKDRLIPIVVISAPILSYFLSTYSEAFLFGYNFGFELLLVNGILTFIGMYLIRDKNKILDEKIVD
jgi:hypothetical protein